MVRPMIPAPLDRGFVPAVQFIRNDVAVANKSG